jgi:putative heme iron utilization protein
MAERPETLRPTDVEAVALARNLMRLARHASLATLDARSGWPSVSRVAVASDHDGAPIVLVSALSSHTAAMIGEPRCSLLLGTPGKGDPLAHARITLACLARRIERETPEGKRIRSRFLRRNPKSTLYADFPDFSFFRLEPQGASLNGGFGKAFELSRENLLLAGDAVEALGQTEEGAVEHMNEDHRDAIGLYARVLGKASTTGWTLSGLDLEGLDLVNGDDVLRIPFAPPLASAEELRMRLVEMAKACRSAM